MRFRVAVDALNVRGVCVLPFAERASKCQGLTRCARFATVGVPHNPCRMRRRAPHVASHAVRPNSNRCHDSPVVARGSSWGYRNCCSKKLALRCSPVLSRARLADDTAARHARANPTTGDSFPILSARRGCQVRTVPRSALVWGAEAEAADDGGVGVGALGGGRDAESVAVVEVDDEGGEVVVAAFSQGAGELLGG